MSDIALQRPGSLSARPLHVTAAFFSAALVFLVEPMIAQLLLPRLGGSPAVWNTSLMFFQAALLLGYGYAHVLQRLGAVRRQMLVHLIVLATAGLALPLHLSAAISGGMWAELPPTSTIAAVIGATLRLGRTAAAKARRAMAPLRISPSSSTVWALR